ncbi:MAG TPA: hypothetical protein VHL14_14095, partial [Steroidobacteraceae bacterium]|nr:hypothetical protein [Steroidobacteraceae bacterium]
MRILTKLSFTLLAFIFAGSIFAATSSASVTSSPFSSPASAQKAVAPSWLSVSGEKIVNQKGETIYLRGFGLGGMLHMENFIDGYAGNEQSVREGLLKVLGKKRYDLFFNEFYKNYFTEEDAAYIQSMGLNLIRIPINYHLFEDDMNPRVIKQDAFA